jgi:transcription termination factor Rho
LEINLDRKLTEKRIFPSIDINKSGTRKEELLLAPKDFNRIIALRRVLSQLSATEAMELLLERLGKTKSNSDFLDSMQSQ